MDNVPVSNPPAARKSNDYRLLLGSLEKAAFTEEGTAFVNRTLAGNAFWSDLSDEEVLRLAAIAQQHGLHDRSLALLGWLNSEHPDCEDGWLEHLELLSLLGRRGEVATLLKRGSRHVPADKLLVFKEQAVRVEPSVDEDFSHVASPFVNMRREQDDLELFLRLFRGREEAFARQWADRNQEKQGYVPVNRPMTTEDVKEHIAGHKTYGLYLLDGMNRVRLGVIDVDLVRGLRDSEERKKAKDLIKREAIYLYKRLTELSNQAGFSCICEMSGGKGYHYWFPVNEWLEASTMKQALSVLVKKIAGDVKCFTLEVFPKQEKLSGKGYGNLVKLPLGIHRGTGRRSRLLTAAGDKTEDQFALLRSFQPGLAEAFLKLADQHGKATVMVHPRHAKWAENYPELATFMTHCPPLGQLISLARAGKTLSVREEKVLLGTLVHTSRGRLLLHHLLSKGPDYNRPLLDYRISRVRGSVLGCKRIHSLLEDHNGQLPCRFDRGTYAHPLLHLPEHRDEEAQPISERVTNLQDALLGLKTAIEQVQRYL